MERRWKPHSNLTPAHREVRTERTQSLLISKEKIMVQANRRMWAGFIVAALGALLVSGQPGRVQAQEKKGGPAKAAAPIETKDLSLDQAHAILAAAVEKAGA